MLNKKLTSRCNLQIEAYKPDLVWLIFDGCIDREAMSEAANRISDGKKYRYRNRVWDVRGCELDLPHEDIIKLVSKSNKLQTGGSCVATLVDRQLHFGLVRIFSAYADEGKKAHQICLDEADLDPLLKKPLGQGDMSAT